jgi:hypothetical protein
MLEKKAGPLHYVSAALVVLGIWYVYGILTHHSGGSGNPIADTTVDVTSMVVFAG